MERTPRPRLAPSRLPGQAAAHSPLFQAGLLAMVAIVGVFLAQGWIDYAIAAGEGALILNRDFQVYYFAAQAFWSGQNPYDLQAVSLAMPRPAWSPFVYPPYALYLFHPFTLLDLDTARLLWLAIRLAFIAALFVAWTRLFAGLAPLHLLIPFALFAFSGALVYDLHTGNIGSIEACLIAWALVWLDRDRPLPFVLLVLLAGAMKMVPLVFLLVPFLVRPWRQALRIALMGGIGVALLVALAWLAAPDLFGQWLHSARQVDWLSRSFYSLAVQSLTFADAADPAAIRRLSAILHLLVAGAVVGATWLALRRRAGKTDALAWAVIVLALLLCWPRLWRYAFVGAMAPILVIALLDCCNGRWGVVRALLLCGLALLLQGGSRAIVPADLPVVFRELIALVAAWLNGLVMLQRKTGGTLPAPPAITVSTPAR